MHYDLRRWLGLSLRYDYFDDMDGARTGVEPVLQSWTVAPIIHLLALASGLRPTGQTYARTRHPINWVDFTLEYRLSHFNRPVFSDVEPGTDILEAAKASHQVQVQMVVTF